MKSVLTAQEWRAIGPAGVGHPPRPTTLADLEGLEPDYLAKAMAIANDLLPAGHPAKLAPYLPEILRRAARHLSPTSAGAARLLKAADTIASLLRPED